MQCWCLTGFASLSEKHAALLGLKAFVLTTPYDVPPWLSDVLMALVRAAGEPAPIKKTVRCCSVIAANDNTEKGLRDFTLFLPCRIMSGVNSNSTYTVDEYLPFIGDHYVVRVKAQALQASLYCSMSHIIIVSYCGQILNSKPSQFCFACTSKCCALCMQCCRVLVSERLLTLIAKPCQCE